METLPMSSRERKRLSWLSRVKDGLVTLRAAAEAMEVSYRQAKRLWRRYRKRGDAGIVHGLRGRSSNHAGRTAERKAALALVRRWYRDFGPTLAAEQLRKRDGLDVDHETLRRWMIAEGVWQRRRKRSPYRRWRARKAHWGEMVQLDGSHHDWLEGRGPRCVLMLMIDDATNRTYAQFFPAESTEAAMTVFADYVRCHGLPQSLYVDRDSIYKTTRAATADETLADTGPLTQFARAMKQLDVELILANSPQAKGRVERRHGVFQDRLVKEMRLEGIGDAEKANAYLRRTFLPDLNARFTVEAVAAGDWHRPVPAEINLAEVLSFQETRRIQNDWTVRWRNRWLQVAARERGLALAGKTVMVRELLDGTIQLVYRNRQLAWSELPQRPEPKRTELRSATLQLTRKPWKPPADHPWRHRRIGKRSGRRDAERRPQRQVLTG